MRKNIKVRVMCLVVAGIMLTSSLAFAAVIGSPYETLKNAIFDAMFYDNVTIEGQVSVVFNGEVLESERIHMVVGDTGTIEYYYLDGSPDGGFSYSGDGIRIGRSYISDDGTQWYNAWVSNSYSSGPLSMGMFGLMSREERSTARFRFMEILLDLAVGDLKNNMTMSTNDGIRSVSGTVTHNQLPELVRVGLDVLIEENQRWYDGDFGSRADFHHPMHIPIRNLTFNRIHGNSDIDADGNLLYLSGNVDVTIENVFGDINAIEFIFEVNFSDIGTSHVQNPIPDAAELLTPEFMERRFGTTGHSINVYFTLNDDGSINEESLTTMWPGQRDWDWQRDWQ